MDLKGNGLDVTLTLHRGNQSRIAFNDDSEEASGRDSRIRMNLSHGDYYVMARLLNHSDADAGKALSLTIEGSWVPHDGGEHQQDRTVAYTMGTTTLPTLSQAASAAASRWTAVGRMEGKDLSVCNGNCSANSDGFLITVKTTNNSAHCDNGASRKSAYMDLTVAVGHRHIWDSDLVIEEPPVGQISVQDHLGQIVHYPAQKFLWTDTASDHNQLVRAGGDVRYKFLPAVVLHEFGHALGLDDLVGFKWDGYLMKTAGTKTSVPSPDAEYLKQVYTTNTD